MSIHSKMHFLLLFCFSSVFVLFICQSACAHGFVHSVLANGQSYTGWNPFTDPYVTNIPARIVRKVLNDGYVDASDVDLACHHGGNNGTSAIAVAVPGSQVVFQWSYWPADHQGPVSTYMTSCNGDCQAFEANNAEWFKVDASGYDPTSKQWAANTLIANNNSWTSTIPAALAPGQYLMRNEIVALHSITPQFYPSCSQIQVTGSGTGKPSDSNLVTMQDVYSGVSWPDIYTDFGTFTIPGPPPAFGDASAANPSVTSTTAAGSSGGHQTSSVSGPGSTGSSSQCHLASRRLIRRHSVKR